MRLRDSVALSCAVLLSVATVFAAPPTDEKRLTKEQIYANGRLLSTMGPAGGTVIPGEPVSLTPNVVLYDQTANANLNSTSQDFEAAYNAYDNQAADDFVVTAGAGWNVTTVFAPGAYSATHGTPTSMRVTFFADAAGVPGATICDFPAQAFVEAPVGTFTIAIPGCVLTAGTKWVSVVANMNFAAGAGGQWFWTTRTVLTGSASRWQNPGNGFGTGCTTWGVRATCLTQTDPDMAYRLDGTLASCTTDADCADGNLCNGVETCTGAACQPGTAVNCDDGDFCTVDTCAPATGLCSHAPNPCSDGDSCTLDTCSAGACSHVSPAPLHFCSNGAISIRDNTTALPYPSSIAVAGLGTNANLCSVEFNGLTHTFPDDVDFLLVGPVGGASQATIMSDAGGGGDVVGVNLVFKDAAATAIPDATQIGSGTFKPANYQGADIFPAPAPAQTANAALAVFNGTNPNGNWSLYVADDAGGDTGTLQGWCVNIVVAGCNVDADCNDGNLCNGTELCIGGVCQAGTAVNCDDGLFCTIDGCIPATGQCTHDPNPCDDGDGCTADSCDNQSGCGHVNQCVTFCNGAGITINDAATGAPTAATPYPSTISVSGLGTQAVVGSVVLRGIQHTFPDDIDMLLVGPAGGGAQNAIIMSDVGGTAAANGVDLTLTDSAANPIPDTGPLVSGTFRPTNVDAVDTFPAPAPAPAGGSALSVFNGDPNGNWSLYVVDDANIDSGTMIQWCINIRVTSPPCTIDNDCNDSDACTHDACVNGHCVLAPISCDDANACTDDFCDQSLGCQHSNNTEACDDSNACTELDACTNGACTGQALICNDFNLCTLDTCNPASGCVFTDNSAACNDNNACTNDSCNPGTGCVNANNANACDDGNPCTVGDVCGGGSCHPGSPVPAPGEVQGVSVAADKSTYSWSATPGATGYDAVRGRIGALPVGPGGADEAPPQFCGLASNSLVDGSATVSGDAFFYISRAKNACATGTYGTQSNGTPRVTTTCP